MQYHAKNVLHCGQGGIIAYMQTTGEVPLETNFWHTKHNSDRKVPFENFMLHHL